jgi:surface carbohydrate biosynthesis protein
MTARTKTLLIPSETRSREFDAKLLLACFAAEQGYDCIVGSRMAMHQAIASLPIGVYIGKDMFHSSAKMLGIMRGLGHDVVAWDEESLVYISEETYLRKRVAPETTKWIRHVFTWGEADRAMKSRASAFRDIPIEAVGNPRIDLLRPELGAYYADDAAELRNRYGRFILVNSNFGALNHLLPARRIAPSAMDAAAIAAFSQGELPFEYWQFREQVFAAFKQMVPALADALPDHRLVIRPHPSEDHGEWLALAAGHGNITITNENAVAPWLLAAEAVIHNGCTTGMEAYLLGRPVICYQPVTHPLYDLELPNGVSDAVADVQGLIELTTSILSGHQTDRTDARKRQLVRHYIAGIDGPLACERIVESLGKHISQNPLPAPKPAERRTAVWKAWRRSMSKRLKSMNPDSKNSPGYTRKRFADLQPADVVGRVARFSSILGRFDDVRTTKIKQNIYKITRS